VEVGVSWGDLPKALQLKWSTHNCNRISVDESSSSKVRTVEEDFEFYTNHIKVLYLVYICYVFFA
jgi:hypothetical protein